MANESIPLRQVLGWGVEEVGGGGDLILNSLLGTWLNLKHLPSFRAFKQLECMDKSRVSLMDLNVSFANQEPRRETLRLTMGKS